MTNNVIAPGGLVSTEEPGESCVFFTDGNGEQVIRLTNDGMEYRGELVKDAGEAYRAMLAYLRHTNSDLKTDEEMRQIDYGLVMDAVNSLMAMTRYATEHIQEQEVQEDYMAEDLEDADKAASALINWLDDDPVIQEEKEAMSRDDDLEQKIQEKGLNAPRLTPDSIKAVIASEEYHTFPGTTLTLCILTLKNGYTVTGESACASPENFNEEIGRQAARDKAVDKIWDLEGYLLRQWLHEGEITGQVANWSRKGEGWLIPRWRCHKEVEAFKISEIREDGNVFAIFSDEVNPDVFVRVNREYVEKHKPEVGGYYVRYKDGYESYSPAEAFEDGYTRI